MGTPQALRWVWFDAVLSSHGPIDQRVRLTAVALFAHMNDDGLTFVGQQRLAERTGAGERSIRRHVESLRSTGWLTIKKERVSGAGHIAWRNTYVAKSPEVRAAVAANEAPPLSEQVAANEAPALERKWRPNVGGVPAKTQGVPANSWPRNQSSEPVNITSSVFSIENRRRQKREIDPAEQARKLTKHLQSDPGASDATLAAMYRVSAAEVHQLRALVQAEATQ